MPRKPVRMLDRFWRTSTLHGRMERSVPVHQLRATARIDARVSGTGGAGASYRVRCPNLLALLRCRLVGWDTHE